MPHLFLFTEEGDCVKLTSYEMPEGYTKDTFTAAGLGRLDYRTLRPSATFTPALYRKNGEWFEGGSESMFTPVLKFSLYERFSNEVLEVSESMEKDGRRTFGYDLPLDRLLTGFSHHKKKDRPPDRGSVLFYFVKWVSSCRRGSSLPSCYPDGKRPAAGTPPYPPGCGCRRLP